MVRWRRVLIAEVVLVVATGLAWLVASFFAVNASIDATHETARFGDGFDHSILVVSRTATVICTVLVVAVPLVALVVDGLARATDRRSARLERAFRPDSPRY